MYVYLLNKGKRDLYVSHRVWIVALILLNGLILDLDNYYFFHHFRDTLYELKFIIKGKCYSLYNNDVIIDIVLIQMVSIYLILMRTS
jgi:hypothetical protein